MEGTNLEKAGEKNSCPVFTIKSVSVSEEGRKIDKFSQHDHQFQKTSIDLGKILMVYSSLSKELDWPFTKNVQNQSSVMSNKYTPYVCVYTDHLNRQEELMEFWMEWIW